MIIETVLVIEPDTDLANRIGQQLVLLGAVAVTLVETVDEALTKLEQGRQELALLPVAAGTAGIAALRQVQPDLRLILVTPTAVELSETFAGRVQAVLIRSMWKIDLPQVLASALAQPLVQPDKMMLETATRKKIAIDLDAINRAFQGAKFSDLLETAVFAYKGRLITYKGGLTRPQAATVAQFVATSMDTEATRVQFMHLPARAGELLLYSQRIADDFLLTLIAQPEASLSALRLCAEELTPALSSLISDPPKPVTVTPILPKASGGETGGNGTEKGVRHSFAIVWRPVQPVPQVLHVPLRRALERIAATNSCLLAYAAISSDLIHLVVVCPVGRDSDWAAFIFKNGSEQIIQQEYQVKVNLWRTGYLAAESSSPLSESELNLFLEKA